MTPEGKVKAKVIKTLKAMGAYHCMPVTGGFGMSGVPDILICLHGRFIAIECKAGKGKVTALQQSNLDAIQRAGGVALVVTELNADFVNELILEAIK
jgi:tartrate dehydratase alpha subunit/fumarate hydratase class I-like protein